MKKDYTKENYKNDKELWLANRGFGGSSCSALMNCNPYMTALDIYNSAINELKNEPREDDNESTQYGKKLEPVIADIIKYNFESKFKLWRPKGYVMFRSKSNPFMTATLDGLLTNLENKEKWILEIKTHDLRDSVDRETWRVGIPKNYMYQCLHYLAVMNDCVGVILVAKLRQINYETGLVDREEIAYYYIMRENAVKTIANLKEVERDFYYNHILLRIPPDVDMPLLEERKEEDNGI